MVPLRALLADLARQGAGAGMTHPTELRTTRRPLAFAADIALICAPFLLGFLLAWWYAA